MFDIESFFSQDSCFSKILPLLVLLVVFLLIETYCYDPLKIKKMCHWNDSSIHETDITYIVNGRKRQEKACWAECRKRYLERIVTALHNKEGFFKWITPILTHVHVAVDVETVGSWWIWIIIIVVVLFLFGGWGNNGCGCNNGCGNNCGCGNGCGCGC